MHRYLIRLRKEVFDLLKVEAKARGISINDFITYCIEVALAEYMNESAEAFKDSVKDKVIQRKGNDYKVSKSHGKMYYDLLNDNLSKSTIVLFTLLLSNSNQKGYAFGSNKYYAEKLKCTTRTISSLLRTLVNKNYIIIEHPRSFKRKIYIRNKFPT